MMMRPALALAALLLAPLTAAAEPAGIDATPVTAFSRSSPNTTEFGKLTFRGGLKLTSSNEHFGGFSGLRLSADGKRLTAVSDRGYWLTADVAYEDGKPKALTGADIRPIPGPGREGTPPIMRDRDAEGLEINFNQAWISLERRHRILRFDLDREGRPLRSVSVPIPPEAKKLGGNTGLESIARLPATHAFPGALLIIAEEGVTSDDHPAWILGAGRPQELSVKHRDGYAITDLAMLPNGDALILERRFRPPFSLTMRLRRIPAAQIMPGEVMDGEVMMEASLSREEIDNMEGVSVHRDGADTVVTLMSDDNFNSFQRTLLLQFTLRD